MIRARILYFTEEVLFAKSPISGNEIWSRPLELSIALNIPDRVLGVWTIGAFMNEIYPTQGHMSK